MKFQNGVYQLLPSKGIRSFAGTWIEISESSEGRVEFLYEGKRISFVRVEGRGELKRNSEEDELLKERVYVKTLVREEPKVRRKTKVVPSANHPWRRAWKKWKKVDVPIESSKKCDLIVGITLTLEFGRFRNRPNNIFLIDKIPS